MKTTDRQFRQNRDTLSNELIDLAGRIDRLRAELAALGGEGEFVAGALKTALNAVQSVTPEQVVAVARIAR